MARGNGEGTIVKRKDGRWMGAVTIGTDPKTGKLDRKYLYGKTRREVAKKMTELKQNIFSGTYIREAEITLGEWLTQWNKGRKNTVSYNTYKAYEKAIRLHIKPVLGHIKLRNLKTRQIQNLINNKFENGRVDGKGGLSIHTVKGIYRVLNAGLKQAVKEKLIVNAPTEAVELPKSKVEKKMHTWTRAEVSRFLDQAKSNKYFMVFFLAVNTGMRRGELLGLKWEDIDFDKNRLEVKRQIIRTNKGIVFTNTKTDSGNRIIPIPDNVVRKLKRHKILQSENKLALGQNYDNNDLVNSDKLGSPINPANIYKEFKEISRSINLPEIRLHDLRHTFSTLFLESKGNMKALQQILGHASISQTMDTYSHVTDEMLNKAAQNIEKMYCV